MRIQEGLPGGQHSERRVAATPGNESDATPSDDEVVCPIGAEPWVEAPSRRPLLAVSPTPVWPVHDGISLRIHHLLQELAADWDITLLAAAPFRAPGRSFAAPPRPPVHLGFYEEVTLAGQWRSAPSQYETAPLVAATQRLLVRRRPVAALLWPGAEFLAWAVPGIPACIADRMDCLALSLWRNTGLAPLARVSAAHDAAAMAAYERRTVRHLPATVVVGFDDAAALRRLGAPGVGDRIHVITNGVDVPSVPYLGLPAAVPTVAFTGNLNYEPNIAAALVLVERIWPLVVAALPTAHLIIAGREPTAAVSALAASPGVSVIANVADMAEVFTEAWVCVAPMVSGSGVKNKVLEAWAHGLPVVMTSLALNGLPLPPGHEAMVADSANAIASALVRMLRSPSACAQVGAEAIRFVESAYTWRTAAAQISKLLTDVRVPTMSAATRM